MLLFSFMGSQKDDLIIFSKKNNHEKLLQIHVD